MGLTGRRTFLGIGFGPIQAGLFLYEAFISGNFGRLVVAEVLPDVVRSVRMAHGWYAVNIAHRDRSSVERVGPIEIEDPAQDSDRERLIEAIASADEIATAVPSVRHYDSDRPGSLHRLLAAGLRKKARCGGPRAVIYAAENHNEAAEILEAAVFREVPEPERAFVGSRVRFLNTVIGKMSGVVSASDEERFRRLTPITPAHSAAFLVESFNRIFISRIRFAGDEPPYERGIGVFEEKGDLLPFEHAKLYGHNSTHALAAYLASVRGIKRITDLGQFPDLPRFLRAAFLQESGEALIRKHCGVDLLFTTDGYRAYCDDLLERMLNPYLEDTVDRIGRDPARKLGWDDRLIGTMRVALSVGIHARRYAFGAAAALAVVQPGAACVPVAFLEELWQPSKPDPARRKPQCLS